MIRKAEKKRIIELWQCNSYKGQRGIDFDTCGPSGAVTLRSKCNSVRIEASVSAHGVRLSLRVVGDPRIELQVANIEGREGLQRALGIVESAICEHDAGPWFWMNLGIIANTYD